MIKISFPILLSLKRRRNKPECLTHGLAFSASLPLADKAGAYPSVRDLAPRLSALQHLPEWHLANDILRQERLF